jgi:hypothetical protein
LDLFLPVKLLLALLAFCKSLRLFKGRQFPAVLLRWRWLPSSIIVDVNVLGGMWSLLSALAKHTPQTLPTLLISGCISTVHRTPATRNRAPNVFAVLRRFLWRLAITWARLGQFATQLFESQIIKPSPLPATTIEVI